MSTREKENLQGQNSGFGLELEEESLSLAEESKGFNWSVPWSDLMMVMFVLFAVLFALMLQNENLILYSLSGKSESQKAAGALTSQAANGESGSLPGNRPKMLSIYRQISRNLNKDALKGVHVLLLPNRSVCVLLESSQHFYKGEIRPSAVRSLNKVSNYLNMYNNPVRIVGHSQREADGLKSSRQSWKLSANRAVNLACFLMDSGEVSPNRLTVMAKGDVQPQVPEFKKSDKAKNSRVEIQLMPSLDGSEKKNLQHIGVKP